MNTNLNFLKNKWIKNIIIILLLSFIGIISIIHIFIQPVTSLPNDLQFQYARMQSLGNYFSSPVNFSSFGNQGKIVNIMYPPWTILPIQIIYNITNSFKIMYYFLWIYASLLLTLISYFIVKAWTKSTKYALIFSLIWTFNLIKYNYVYAHGSYSNVISLAFYPLIFYGAMELFFKNYKKWYILVIGLILVTHTHILSTLVILIALLIIYIYSLFKVKFDKNRFKYILFSILIFSGGIISIVIPIIEQYKSYDLISANLVWTIDGFKLPNYFIKTITNDSTVFYDSYNGSYIGLFNFVSLILCYIFKNKFTSFEKSLLLVTIIFLFLGSNLAFWKFLRYTPLVQLQYPIYRFAPIINFIATFLIVKLLLNMQVKFKLNKIMFNLIIFTIILFNTLTSIQYTLNWQNNKTQYLKCSNVEIKDLVDNNKYYDFKQLDYTNRKYTKNGQKNWTEEEKKLRDDFTINDKKINVETKISNSLYEINYVNTVKNSHLIIPISVYKGLQIKLNQKNINPVVSKYGTLDILLENTGKINIKLTYHWTIVAKISQIISLMVFIIIGIIIKTKQKNYK